MVTIKLTEEEELVYKINVLINAAGCTQLEGMMVLANVSYPVLATAPDKELILKSVDGCIITFTWKEGPLDEHPN